MTCYHENELVSDFSQTAHLAASHPSLSAECQTSLLWTYFDFHVVSSSLCFWLVCFFSKQLCHLGKVKSAGGELKKEASPPCQWKYVRVCKMCVNACFFVPRAGEWGPQTQVAFLRDVLRLCIRDTSVWEQIFCESSLLLFLFLSSPPTHHSPLPLCPSLHTSKERKKLVHSWFGTKKIK